MMKCLNISLQHYCSISNEDQDRLSMLLLRYNETLNLPYTYERIESYWRILESLSTPPSLTMSDSTEYNRIRSLLGKTKHSKNLKSFLKTLLDYQIAYTDEQIKNSFDYRNLNTHEYLNNDLTQKNYLSDIFMFLNKAIELVILSVLDIDHSYYQVNKYSIIINRVL